MQFKQWLEAISSEGYGIYEEEAFKNRNALNALRTSTQEIGSKVEVHPKEPDESKVWNIKYIKFNPDEIDRLESITKAGMHEGWYSLLWTPTEIRVIFSTGTHRMPNTSGEAIPSFDVKHLKGISPLAKQHGLDVNYMREFLGKGMSDFSRQFESPQNPQ